ncbi:MAG: YbaB/EbfC family nucleoid-associated protein [Rhodospirillaceae bacterium]|nr:YbaB/EbfC family nucleoid-associated protein [Rhodospirillaceae bacterium]|tara:strand:+ start:7116 stop:7436 length:321 start_codon:yes stop_codon:yes gene_type:complete
MKGLGQLMKQAQQMQEDMQKAQDALASIEVSGESGGGMVKVRMTCKHHVVGLDIESDLLSDDKEMLEDLIAAALNDAIRKVEITTQEKMSGLTGGFSLPAGMKLPL